MRRAIHLVQRGVTPLTCIACGAISPIVSSNDLHRAPAVCFLERDWNTIYVNNKDYRRCIDPFDPPLPVFPTPTEEGYYWAEWRQAEKHTLRKQDATPCFFAEVVEVVYDMNDDPKRRLKVYLFGVSVAQSVDCFVWRSEKIVRP